MLTRLCGLALSLTLLVSPLAAQQAVSSGTVAGTVFDPAGAPRPGARVTITNVDRNQTQSAVTDARGRFRFALLPVGEYRLRANSGEESSEESAEQPLRLTIGAALDVPLRLRAVRSESIEVIGVPPLVESKRTQVSTTISPEEVRDLPLNGRNYLDLALLAPGVSRTNTGANQRFAETSAVPGTGISVSTQRNLASSFIVDGLSANDDAAELAGTFFSQEVIREFAVVRAGGVAEFGRASAGVVNIATQSGTNAARGDVYGFFRKDRLDAANTLTGTKLPLDQKQFGAAAGGPLLRDRSFYFTNFEQLRQRGGGVIVISPPNVAAINARLDAAGYGGPRIITGAFDSTLNTTNVFARADHAATGADQLTARLNTYDVTSVNARNAGGLNSLSRATELENHDRTLAASNLLTLGADAVSETRGQVTRSRLTAPPNDLVGPAVTISGIASFGTATNSPTARDIDLYEVVQNVTRLRGSHSLKSGVDLLRNRVTIRFPGALQGAYTFQNLANFLAGRYSSFQQAFGNADTHQTNDNLGAFVQDEWRVTPRLTVNGGLRYDVQRLPSLTLDRLSPAAEGGGPTRGGARRGGGENAGAAGSSPAAPPVAPLPAATPPVAPPPSAALVHTRRNNFSPRLGAAFDLHGDGRAVLRAAAGIYYGPIPLRAVSNALQRDGVHYRVAQVSQGLAGAPVFPNVFPTFPTNVLTNITTMDPHIRNSRSAQATLQIEQQVGASTAASVAYEHLRGHDIIMSRNVNVPTTTDPTVPNLGRPDPNFGNNGQFQSIGDSWYDGVTVALTRRPSRWGSYRLSYTFSKGLDTSGNFFFSQPQDANDIAAERGRSDNDQRHRLAVSGTLNAPGGFLVSAIFTYTSALPFNIQLPNDRNGDTNFNDRPAGVGRNTGRGFDYRSLDLRLSRAFPLRRGLAVEAIVDAFNVINRENDQVPNNIITSPTFGRPTAVNDSRQVQLGVRVLF